jgi:hypothetical protein
VKWDSFLISDANPRRGPPQVWRRVFLAGVALCAAFGPGEWGAWKPSWQEVLQLAPFVGLVVFAMAHGMYWLGWRSVRVTRDSLRASLMSSPVHGLYFLSQGFVAMGVGVCIRAMSLGDAALSAGVFIAVLGGTAVTAFELTYRPRRSESPGGHDHASDQES